MKQPTQIKHCITKVIEVKRSYNLTPQQNRYVDKRTREVMKFQMPLVPKKLPDHLIPAEIYQLFKVSKDNTRFLIEFLIMTGLRINEARCLLIQHIDLNNNQLKVVSGKGGKDRYVPLSENMIHKIKMFTNKRQSGYLFAKSNNTQYTKRALQKKVEKAIKLSGFTKKLSTHSLRHTFACLCLSRGMRLEDIQLLMGHSRIETTQIYAKLELGDIKEKYLQLMGNV